MKKKSLVFLFIVQLLPAQSYNLYHHNGGNDNFINIILSLTIMIPIFSGIFYVLAYFEGRKKVDDYAIKSINYEIWAWLFTFVLLVSGLIYLLYINDVNPYLAILPSKIIIASVVSYYAKNKNRNPLLWWFLGFLEYHSALIVLATTKAFLPMKKGSTNTDKVHNEKLIKLNSLVKDSLIDEEEMKKKKIELEKEYSQDVIMIQNHNTKQEQNDFLIKLEDAYKQGLLTEKEYQNKLLKYKPIENDF